MPTVNVYNMAGSQTGEIELSELVFGVEFNEAVVHQVVKMQLASLRLGTHKTKKRDEVRGGGKKPWRQKGTGRARAGSIRSPLWVGGGVVFGPQPRGYSITGPRKVRRLALKSALSAKLEAGELIVIDSIKLAEIKTKRVVEFLNAFDAPKKALIVTADYDEVVARSGNNIAGVKTVPFDGINVFDLLHHDKILVDQAALAKITEVYA